MLNSPEFLGEITSTWAWELSPISREIVECAARASVETSYRPRVEVREASPDHSSADTTRVAKAIRWVK